MSASMKSIWFFLPSIGGLLLGACSLPQAQPDTTRFYLLTAAAAKTEAGAVAQPVRVALRPVVAPEFLRGKLIAVRAGDNEERFIDEARWAEPLEAGLTRVLRENLAQRPGWQITERGETHDFEVAVRLRHCEGALPAGVARLAARVEIFSTEPEPRLVAQDDFSTDIPGWDGRDYGQLAKKLSEAADALAGRIAALVAEAKK